MPVFVECEFVVVLLVGGFFLVESSVCTENVSRIGNGNRRALVVFVLGQHLKGICAVCGIYGVSVYWLFACV